MPNFRPVLLIFALLFALDLFVWHSILFSGGSKNLELHFLNVGQGDSGLVNLPVLNRWAPNVQVLIDGGPDARVLNQLSKAIGGADRYIDLVVSTHSDADHLSGLLDVLKRYKIGAIIWNGREGDTELWQQFVRVVEEKKISLIKVKEGDKMVYGDNIFYVLSPDPKYLGSAASNDAVVAMKLVSSGAAAIFASDAPPAIEKNIAGRYNISAEILKVAHHGSRFSSTEDFLNAVKPKISVIQVGKNNYGHPTAEVLSRLKKVGSSVYRNDLDGLIKIVLDGESIKVMKKRD